MFDDDFSWRSALAWLTTVIALATAAQPGWVFHSVWGGAAWVGGATAMVVGRWLVRRGVVKLAGTGSQETLNRSDRGPIGRA